MDAVTTQPVDRLAELPLSDERRAALRDVLGAFFSSRALVWVAGILAVLAVGFFPGGSGSLDPHHLTAPFHQRLLNILISPATRWDSAWYLAIAKTGYALSYQTVFFPIYPGLIALGGALVGSGLDAIVGIVVSCAGALGALYLLHRLVTLEFDAGLARNTVWIFAWLPTALALSAVYSEALFLLLAVGSFYAGRTGRWALAGLLGGLAAVTRNGGILLLLPLLTLYLYGPRMDREPDRIAGGLSPRYRLRRDASWIALVPLGLLAYIAYLYFTTGQPLGPFVHQSHWGRHFFPFEAIPLAVWGVFREIAAAIPGLDPHLARHMTSSGALRHFYDLAFLVLSLFLLRLCWKRLPAAYTVFAAASLAMAISVPATNEPLKSFPRFTLVMFPLWIALSLWATERRLVRTVIAVSAPLLALYAYLFVSWSWTP
ncbi:MAG TPA: mannosyltransferase family protein [Solirubrobacterales bacterium]|nr:mannosyltransferase family protein [Solirubrobacterales bacterium]